MILYSNGDLPTCHGGKLNKKHNEALKTTSMTWSHSLPAHCTTNIILSKPPQRMQKGLHFLPLQEVQGDWGCQGSRWYHLPSKCKWQPRMNINLCLVRELPNVVLIVTKGLPQLVFTNLELISSLSQKWLLTFACPETVEHVVLIPKDVWMNDKRIDMCVPNIGRWENYGKRVGMKNAQFKRMDG